MRLRVKSTLLALCAVAACLSGPARAQNLTAGQVDLILSRAVQEAQARGVLATVAVSDRVGNILGVFRMTGGSDAVTITSGRNIPLGNGLESVTLGTGGVAVEGRGLAAVAKAITGAYLSSSGNAFTTRTASQIVQENFNVGETFQAGGPLFGVQFSQLPCSDLTGSAASSGTALGIGPRRSPLGLSADPGGLPLYINGQVVGGIGVEADGLYTLDRFIGDYDRSVDELVAIAGQTGFEPPEQIKAYRISAGGRTLRYSDVDNRDLASNPGAAPAAPAGGAFIAVAGYFTAGASRAGTAYGTSASGYSRDNVTFGGLPAVILDNGAGANRFPPTASAAASLAAGDRLTAPEVTNIITQALFVMYRARAAIRQPLGSFMEATVSVVDNEANVLGIARTPDAPVFGTDVSLQKARTAGFMSQNNPALATPNAAADLTSAGNQAGYTVNAAFTVPGVARYIATSRGFAYANIFADGTAWGARSIGNLARPFYPDGVNGNGNGSLSLPFGQWSPFNVGLQLDLVLPDIVARLGGSALSDAAAGCVSNTNNATGVTAGTAPQVSRPTAGGPTLLANGMQIFAGGVSIWRGSVMVGAIGISGDGIDQDDMAAFLGLNNGATNGLGNAAPGIRVDQRQIQGIAPRYVSCPFKPFNGSREQEACRGK